MAGAETYGMAAEPASRRAGAACAGPAAGSAAGRVLTARRFADRIGALSCRTPGDAALAISDSRDRHLPLAGILWMAAAALCFSASLSLVKALQDFGMTVFQAVLMRQVLGLVVFLPVLARHWPDVIGSDVLPRHFVRAALGFLGMCSAYYSLSLIHLADSVALQFTLPFFVMIFAVWVLGERLRPHRVIATAAGFAGVMLIVRPGFGDLNHGIFFALAGAAFYAASDVNARRLARDDPLPAIMIWNFLFTIPLAALPGTVWWVTPPPGAWWPVLGFAAAGVGAQFCLTRSLGMAEAGLVAPILFLRLPIIAAVGYLWFGQETEIWTWAGAGVIFVATIWMTRAEAGRPSGRPRNG